MCIVQCALFNVHSAMQASTKWNGSCKNFWIFFVPAAKNTLQPCFTPLLVLIFCCFHAFLHIFHSYLSVYFHLLYHLTLQMTILAIVPGKPKMCLQENLVDCADCEGLLDAVQTLLSWSLLFAFHFDSSYIFLLMLEIPWCYEEWMGYWLFKEDIQYLWSWGLVIMISQPVTHDL